MLSAAHRGGGNVRQGQPSHEADAGGEGRKWAVDSGHPSPILGVLLPPSSLPREHSHLSGGSVLSSTIEFK